jgi:hypothetical protein
MGLDVPDLIKQTVQLRSDADFLSTSSTQPTKAISLTSEPYA